MVFLPDFFQRRQPRLIGLRLPVGEVVDLLMDIDFGDGRLDLDGHGDYIVR